MDTKDPKIWRWFAISVIIVLTDIEMCLKNNKNFFIFLSATDNVTGLKNRYTELYIPSDFTNSKNPWINSLPLNRPLKFTSRCLFHIMNKEAHSIEANNAIFDAPDADHTWTVKVNIFLLFF